MISIVTPTYNRAYILKNLYSSLKRQSIKEFEWIVVDDGSNDGTRDMVETWLKDENEFDIKYFFKSNGGKHTALNYAIPKAEGEFIFIVDSDDYLTDNAIEMINQWTRTIEGDDSFAGVSGLKGYSNSSIIGQFPKGKVYVDAKNSQRRRLKLEGDKAEVYRKDVLIQYPFPEYDGENFITESSVWNRIALDGYKLRWFGQIIYIAEYLEDGLTYNNNEYSKKNFYGYQYSTLINRKALSFPFNYNFVAAYIDLAEKLGYDSEYIKTKMELNELQYIICIVIKYVRKARELFRNLRRK